MKPTWKRNSDGSWSHTTADGKQAEVYRSSDGRRSFWVLEVILPDGQYWGEFGNRQEAMDYLDQAVAV